MKLVVILCAILIIQHALSLVQIKYYKKSLDKIISNYKGADGYFVFSGMERSKFGPGAIVIMVVDRDYMIHECCMLKGMTIFTKFKPLDSYKGSHVGEILKTVKEKSINKRIGAYRPIGRHWRKLGNQPCYLFQKVKFRVNIKGERIMEWVKWFGEHFIGMFNAGGETFMGLFTGIVPTLVVLLTFTYAIMKFVGEDRVTRIIQFAAKYRLLRYTLMPVLSVLLLTNPMAYTFGRFLPEKQKPAFYDSAVSFVHPVTGLFPYANAGELFVYLGIANGIKELGLPVADLAVRYFLVGIVIILIRGIVTELITNYLAKKKQEYNKGGSNE